MYQLTKTLPFLFQTKVFVSPIIWERVSNELSSTEGLFSKMAITSYGSIGDDVTHNSDVEADQDQVNRDRDNSQTEYTSLLPNGSDESTNNTSACCSISSPKYKYILGESREINAINNVVRCDIKQTLN